MVDRSVHPGDCDWNGVVLVDLGKIHYAGTRETFTKTYTLIIWRQWSWR